MPNPQALRRATAIAWPWRQRRQAEKALILRRRPTVQTEENVRLRQHFHFQLLHDVKKRNITGAMYVCVSLLFKKINSGVHSGLRPDHHATLE
jgi:hypothetical protein